MDPELQHHLAKFRTQSDAELYQQMGYVEGSAMWAAAKAELARRESRRAFWRRDIWVWVAVGISLISLSVAILS